LLLRSRMDGRVADEQLNAAELRGLVDELAAMIPEIARGHKRVYDGFREVGFDEAQALTLTIVLLHQQGRPERRAGRPSRRAPTGRPTACPPGSTFFTSVGRTPGT